MVTIERRYDINKKSSDLPSLSSFEAHLYLFASSQDLIQPLELELQNLMNSKSHSGPVLKD